MSKEMIKITDLQKSFGELHVLNGVNLTIKEKEVVVITAPSTCHIHCHIYLLQRIIRCIGCD